MNGWGREMRFSPGSDQQYTHTRKRDTKAIIIMTMAGKRRGKDAGSGRSGKAGAKRKASTSAKPSLLDRDWQRITDHLQVLLGRISAAPAGEPLTDAQVPILAVKVVKDLGNPAARCSRTL